MEVIYLSDYNPMKAVKEFHDTFAPNQREATLDVKLDRRWNLIKEEADEVLDALDFLERTHYNETSYTVEEAKAELAGELADLLYMVYGTAEELDIPMTKVFNAVHGANMRKVWDDGQVHRNEYGKILKPPNFQKANLYEVIYGELDEA